jgi:hypothetical protein
MFASILISMMVLYVLAQASYIAMWQIEKKN